MNKSPEKAHLKDQKNEFCLQVTICLTGNRKDFTHDLNSNQTE